MNKKDRKKLSNVLTGFYLLIALSIFWMVFKSTNYYILGGIVLATPFIEVIIYNMLPDKQVKKKISTKKNAKQNGKKSKAAPNRLRADDIILTLQLEELSWREFERLCFLYFKAKGFNPRETSEGADGGVDLIIYNRKHKTEEAIQINIILHQVIRSQ